MSHAPSATGPGRFMPLLSVLVALALVAAPNEAYAEEVYVVRFQAPGPLVEPPCGYLGWHDHLVFHNSTSQEASIRLLGVSNGNRRNDAIDLPISPGRTSSVSGTALSWNPNTSATLWINRLEVPIGTFMTSRLEATIGVGAPCPISTERRVVVALPFPVFRALTPPNVKQFHLATDVGSDRTGSPANARLNVGIYNASASRANAKIEMRRGCDDSLVASGSMVIEPNTIVQVPNVRAWSGRPPDLGSSCSALGTPYRAFDYNLYAIVVVDQPSLSYAVSVSNELPINTPITVSFTQ